MAEAGRHIRAVPVLEEGAAPLGPVSSPASKKQSSSLLRKIVFPFKKSAKLLLVFFRLVKIRPKIIHCFLDDSAFVACIYKLLFGAKVVFEVHSISKIASPIGFSFKELVACKLADELIVMSHRMKEIIVKDYGVGPEKVHVIWGPIDLKIFRPAPRKKSKAFTVCYGGNDSRYQGLSTILRAAELLLPEKSIRFKLMGFDGSKYGARKNVEFKGAIKGDKRFAQELSSSDVFLSAYEGGFSNGAYPHKMSTYLSLGRPMIVSDVSDCKRIAEESGAGFVFPPGNPKALAEAVMKAYSLRGKRLEAMGKKARRFAEKNMDSGKLYEKLRKIYF